MSRMTNQPKNVLTLGAHNFFSSNFWPFYNLVFPYYHGRKKILIFYLVLYNRSSFLFKEFDDLENMDPALAEFERNRREYINTMKRIRLENPDITPQELEVKAQAEVMNKGPKSRAYYR